MQYEQPKYIEENINVSKTSDLAEFTKYIVIILALVFTLLGFTNVFTGFAVQHFPPVVEKKLGSLVGQDLRYDDDDKRVDELQSILDELTNGENLPFKKYEIRVVNSDKINAMAVPGGIIGVTKGLLDHLESEDEIAFVIGHELGHFKNKDHLKSLGRGISAVLLSTILLGADSDISKFFMATMNIAEAKYSQEQEKAADLYGLKLLYKNYANAYGSIHFMEKILKESKFGKLIYFFASHPHPELRLAYLKQEILLNRMNTNEQDIIETELNNN